MIPILAPFHVLPLRTSTQLFTAITTVGSTMLSSLRAQSSIRRFGFESDWDRQLDNLLVVPNIFNLSQITLTR